MIIYSFLFNKMRKKMYKVIKNKKNVENVLTWVKPFGILMVLFSKKTLKNKV